jgi:acyl dehydratase
MRTNTIGNYLEDFEEGEVIRHAPSKTIFESDNNLFSLLTMNWHPVHTNAEYAAGAQHGRILVVGTLVFSIVVGMTVNDVSGKAVANLDYEKVEHLAPVFVGDTLRAETRVLSVRESASKPDRGVVYVETTGFNQRDVAVVRFKRHVLVLKGGGKA